MAGDLRVSMLFQANAAQAKAEVTGLQSAFEQLGRGAKAAGDASNSAAPDIGSVGQAAQGAAGGISLAAQAGEEWGVFVQELRAQVQPMVGELAGLQNAMQSVALLEEVGAINAQEAALAHDQLARATTDLLGRMDAAGVSIDGTTAAMARQETAAQELINRTTGVSNAQEASIADTLRHGAALDDLRARYNPLFAASRQYEVELRNIAEAERLGAISSNEAAAARGRASQALAPMPAQLGQLGGSSQQAAQHVGQLGYQLNDIVMMMSLGQNPFMLMAQQGPQVTQVFDQIRRSGHSIGGTIAGAFTSMLNPMNLVTMAVIGFGAAAVQWFVSSADEAKAAADAMSELADIQGRLEASGEILAMSIDKLIEKYGSEAFAIREVAKALRERQVAQAQDKLKTGISEAADEWDRYAAKMDAATARREYGSAEDLASQGIAVDLSAAVEKTQQTIQNLQEDLRVSEADAIRLADAFGRVRDAASFEDRLAALQGLQAIITDIEGTGVKLELDDDINSALIAAGELTIELGGLAGAIQPGKEEAAALFDIIEDARAGMDALFGAAPGAGWLSGAIADAAALASELWNAATASGSIGSPGGVVSAVSGGVQTVVDWFSGSDLAPESSNRPKRAPPLLGEAGKGNNSGTGRSGSGSGRASATKEETSAIQKLIEQEQRQIDVLQMLSPLQEEIARHHKDLKGATEEERAAVAELVEERMRLQEVRDRLDEIESTGENVFKGLLKGAMDFDDALSNILGSLADMAASAAWDMIWSGGSGGGAGGGLAGWFGDILGLAEGGRVSGPGGPRDDKVPAWLSNDEFVVNAAAAGPAYPFLEALNAGVPLDRLIGFVGGRPKALADGGLVGGGVSPSIWGLGGTNGTQDRGTSSDNAVAPIINMNITINGAKGDTELRQMVEQGVHQGLKQYNDQVLPGRVAQISRSPRDR